MGSRREEERNEKIIRGLMKLPPNRRCINCNSLGPQYVCTNFWSFVCITCSGIHREFTHRVKSVSMAKFTSQEVDALQKGGNQRARELFLKAWDPDRKRHPDNSNADKIREFIKSVYIDKKYTAEKSSDKPPRDIQRVRSHEDEMRRASSYHSYSQSPPNDFQYEERLYGKHVPALTRKPGSDRGLYEGKVSTFSSPSRFSDQANDDRYGYEGSYRRTSDYSVSSGGDPFRSDVQSPNSQGDVGSPFSETSRDLSREIPENHKTVHNSDANSRSDAGRVWGPQRPASSGSFGSSDGNAMPFKSVKFADFPEAASGLEKDAKSSKEKPSSLLLVPQSSVSSTLNGLDLFQKPLVPQNDTSIASNGSNAQSVDLFQQSPVSLVPTFSEQPPRENLQASQLDFFAALSQQQSVTSSNVKTSVAVMPNNGGWATFDVFQNSVPVGTEKCAPAAMPSSDGNMPHSFNPFSLDHSSSCQSPSGHEPSTPTQAFWPVGLQNVGATTSNTQFWNTFESSAGQQPVQKVLKSSEQAAVLCASDPNMSLGFGVYEASINDGNVMSSYENMASHDLSMVPPLAGVHSPAIEHKTTNPFDLPYDADLESSNTFWDMNVLRAALPNNHAPAPAPAPFVGGVSQSWFPPNSVASYVPGGVAFDPPSGSLGFMSGQAPSSQISNVPAQDPVASIGGNPFA